MSKFCRPWLLLLALSYVLLLLAGMAQGNLLSRILFQRQLQERNSWPSTDMGPFRRTRKNMRPRQPRVCAPNRPPYECGDGLMGVWLRLMKNPDYAE